MRASTAHTGEKVTAHSRRLILQGTALVLGYWAASQLGYYFALTPSGISPLWPPTGLALASTILVGYRMLPFVFLGALFAHSGSEMSALAGVGGAIGNTLEAFLGAFLTFRLVGTRNPLDRPLDLTLFLLVAVVLSTMVGAAIGIISLSLAGDVAWENFVSLWRIWWLGDIFGDVVVAPFLIAWARRPPRVTFEGVAEATLLFVLTFGVSKIVFGGWLPEGYTNYPIEHLCLPLLLWATFRFGRRGTTTATLVITAVAAVGTARGFGPYFLGTKIESLHLLQLFIGTSSITMLFVAAVRVQHRTTASRLIESESLYETAVQTLPLNIFRKDLAGRLVFANKKYLDTLKQTEEEVIGKDDFELFDFDLASQYRRDDWTVVDSKRTLKTIEKFRDRDGNELYTQVVKAPVRDSQGRIVGTMGAFWDITEQKQQEQQLREAKKAAESANLSKSKFLANMSHEMRTPLGAILGFAERIALPLRTENERLADVARIKRSVRNLTELIDDILDLSKVEAGKLKIEHVQFDLLTELEDIYLMLNPQAVAKGLSLTFEFKGQIPVRIGTDSHRLRQILINIIGNAIKFTDAGTVRVTVTLTDSAGGSVLSFRVADSGCGIPPHQVPQLFQPFVQADSSTTRRYGGTGLGLILSRKLARALGGEVSLIRTGLGAGSEFEVMVRCSIERDVPYVHITQFPEYGKRHLKPVSPSASQLEGVRVLLVEDGPDNQELIQFFLASSGASVDLAVNGKEAIDAATAKDYHAILMDIQMPVLDGYSATRVLRASGYRNPIIALTAHAMVEEKKRCFEAGCDGYITKPVFRETLIDAVEQFAKKAVANGGLER